jgi:hypothetical protein
MATYTITLNASYDAALAALATESGYLAADLVQSFVISGLQDRVLRQQQAETDALLDTFTKAKATETKAQILAAKAEKLAASLDVVAVDAKVVK